MLVAKHVVFVGPEKLRVSLNPKTLTSRGALQDYALDVAGATLDLGKTQEIKNTTGQIKHTEWLGLRSG